MSGQIDEWLVGVKGTFIEILIDSPEPRRSHSEPRKSTMGDSRQWKQLQELQPLVGGVDSLTATCDDSSATLSASTPPSICIETDSQGTDRQNGAACSKPSGATREKRLELEMVVPGKASQVNASCHSHWNEDWQGKTSLSGSCSPSSPAAAMQPAMFCVPPAVPYAVPTLPQVPWGFAWVHSLQTPQGQQSIQQSIQQQGLQNNVCWVQYSQQKQAQEPHKLQTRTAERFCAQDGDSSWPLLPRRRAKHQHQNHQLSSVAGSNDEVVSNAEEGIAGSGSKSSSLSEEVETEMVPPPNPENPDSTAVVLRNMPITYTRKMVLALLNGEGFSHCYNFIYLPIDFKTECCLGYVFVNLLSVDLVKSFWKKFNGYSTWAVPSRKCCRVTWSAPQQSLQEYVDRYRNSPIMSPMIPEEYKPLVFEDGKPVDFPAPTRPMRALHLRKLLRSLEQKPNSVNAQ